MRADVAPWEDDSAPNGVSWRSFPLALSTRAGRIATRAPRTTRSRPYIYPARRNGFETGAIPQNTNYGPFEKLVKEVIGAAYTAFHSGLHAALYLSAALALAAGLLAAITLRSQPVDAGS